MSKKNISERLDRLFDDPLKGTLRQNKKNALSALRSKLESIERHSKDKRKTPQVNIVTINEQTRNHPHDPNFRYSTYPVNIDLSPQVADIYSLSSVGQKVLPTNEKALYCAWENDFPLDHSHGEILLNSIFRVSTDIISAITRDSRLAAFNPRDAVFIDTETTGLAGGTGTLAFLVGLGFYKDDRFIVRQYFMRDYGEEESALRSLVNFVSDFKFLVSFNGRGYDIPLLDTRLILNRIGFRFADMPHFDLLYPSRAIFKHRLNNCRLQSIEKHVLRFYREEDIPSAEIPYLYFRYLRSRNPALMDKVFYHNNMDIVSLAVLAAKVTEYSDESIHTFEHGEDIFGVAHMFYNFRDYRRADLFYKEAMSYSLPYPLRERLLCERSIILKREGNLSEAAEIWLGMIDGLQEFNLFPYEELAKYYEHTKRAFGSAIDIVGKARESLETNRPNISTINYSLFQKRILHRLNRLEKKLGGKRWR